MSTEKRPPTADEIAKLIHSCRALALNGEGEPPDEIFVKAQADQIKQARVTIAKLNALTREGEGEPPDEIFVKAQADQIKQARVTIAKLNALTREGEGEPPDEIFVNISDALEAQADQLKQARERDDTIIDSVRAALTRINTEGVSTECVDDLRKIVRIIESQYAANPAPTTELNMATIDDEARRPLNLPNVPDLQVKLNALTRENERLTNENHDLRVGAKSTEIERLLLDNERLVRELTAKDVVCSEILSIMSTYHEQEVTSYGVDTPGGLEHMGDVWSLFLSWEVALKGVKSDGQSPTN